MHFSMERPFKFKIIIILLGLTGFSASTAPKLNVPEEWVFEVELDEKDNPIKPLVITCEGDRKLTWQTEVPDEYHKIAENFTYGKYFSSITIEDPVPGDTGYFTCKNDIGETVTTYIYVSDGEPFVTPTHHQKINVEIGEPIKLDCRTTDPKIRVTVYKDSNEDVTSQFENDSFYRFQKIAESLQETGIYSCREDQLSREITWLVNVEPRKTIQKPSIEKHRNSFHAVGVEFSLNCTIPVKTGDDPSIKWEIPNSAANFKVSNFTNKEPNVFRIQMLTMKSPTLRDSGTYKCIVRQGDQTKNEKIKIDVQESITPFVKFDKNDTSHDVLFVKEKEPFQWVLYFQGFPKNLTWNFYDPFNRTIYHKRPRVSVKYFYEEGKLSLEINNTTAQDFGRYRARLTAANEIFDETGVVLVVNATPKVVFASTPDLFPDDENVSLKTFILAFTLTDPRPKVSWWLYNDCPKGIGSCNKSNRIILNHHLSNEPNKPRNHFESTVSLKPSSGVVECEVENFFGKNSTKMQVNVSDKEKAFLFSVLTEKGQTHVENGTKVAAPIDVIEGDTLTIDCYALNFLYKDLSFPSEGSQNCSTTLSSGKCLTVNNVGMQDDGLYECQATSKTSEKEESLSFTMRVIEKVLPSLLPHSNVSENGEIISVKASEPFSIACFVYGRPKPNITWLKDGKNIQEIPHFVDNERVFLQHDNQLIEFKFAQREYEGVYTCYAENRVGMMEPYVSLVVQGAGLSPMHWVLVSLAILFILALCTIVVFLVVRIRKESKLRNELHQNRMYLFEKGNVGDLNKECTIDEQVDLLPYDKAFEVEKERIKLGKQLGAGAFGRVMQGQVDDLEEDGKTTRVAVKMCKDGADMAHLRALTLELKIMVHLGKHLNIVNLMGAHTASMEKGDLWILVEYCKYGNLLKHIQKYKSRFVNQVDSNTGIIDIHRMTPLLNECFSPTSLGRHSYGFGRTSNVDADGYLETRSHTDSMRGTRPFTRSTSITSNAGSSSGTSRPGIYVGNPHYTTVGFSPSQTSQSTDASVYPSNTQSDSNRDHYVTATQLPSPHPPSVHETSTSIPSYEGGYHMTLNTEMTMVSSPPPFSPSSSTSEPSFFGNPLECGGIPGVSVPFTTTQLMCWAWQVTNGMEYLTKRKVLHGDLAARNLLLAENNVVKISDFGLSRDIYKTDIYMKQGDEIMPIKWMAPEAIQQKVFSIQSDVWAFGVTLWEMFTLGNNPYPGVPLNQDFPVALENGMRMEKPKFSNEEMYDLMMKCWRLDPVERPSFSRIAEMLSEMLSPESREIYVAMNDVLMRKNEEWMEFKEDYLTMVTSPDFQNLNAPVMDESYIPMQIVKDSPDEQDITSGYLDMKSMRSSPAPNETIFSPRPLSAEKETEDNIFTFSGEQIPLTEEQQSPAETSNLLGDVNSPEFVETSNELRNNNNNINKLNSLNQNDQQPLYQNLEKVALNNLQSYIEPGDGGDEEETKRNYMNIPKPANNYVNAEDLV